MKLSRIALFAALIFGTGAFLFSQASPNLENGFKPYGSYQGGNTDTTNMLNGNLILHIPMPFSYPQRGGQLNPQTLLTISSKQWMVDCQTVGSQGEMYCAWDTGPVQSVVAIAGHGVDFDLTTDMVLTRTISEQNVPGIDPVWGDEGDYALYTADGSIHGVRNMSANALEMADGYHVDFTAYDPVYTTIPIAGVLTDRRGNRYTFGNFSGRCTSYQDTLANLIVSSCSQATYFGGLAMDANGNTGAGSGDTIARPVLSSLLSFVNTTPTNDFGGCVSAISSITSAQVFSYLGPNGASNQIKKCYTSVSIQPTFSEPNVHHAGTAVIQALATLVLPDGTNWNFQYDNYGNVTRIGLPLGGSVSYVWEEIAQPPCGGYTAVSRAVKSRTETDNIGNSYTWNYFWGTDVNGTITNVVNDPPGNDTVHVFTNLAQVNAATGACVYYETSTLNYQGPQSNGKLLQRVDTQYSNPVVSPGIVVPLSIQTTVYPSGKVSLLSKTYAGTTLNTQLLRNVASEKQYDWGQGAPGPLLRETDYTYQWEVNAAYLTARMLDLPATVVIKDGSGNRTAETDYFYDETGLQPHTGTLPAGTLVAAPNPAPVRGNLTTVKKWLNTRNSFVTSQTKWYDTGEPYQQIDPSGHTTTFTYDAAYAGAYLTQTCSPQTGSVTHCVSGTYDFITGLITSLSNENATTPAAGNTPGDSAHTSNYTYDTVMPRLTLAQAPPDPSNNGAQAQSTFTYPPNPPTFPYAVTRQKSITTGLTDSSTTTFDGLGRPYKGQHVLSAGTAEVDTTFDAYGHAATVSNSYFTTADPTYGTTTNLYDALGRIYQTTKQDGSISKTAYSVPTTIAVNGDCVQTTDEAGNQRGACTDALGRLVEVDEPNPGNPVQVNYLATLLTDGNFVLENAAGTGVWSTGTWGTNASSIFMQDDANLVLYIFKWQAGVYVAPTGVTIPYDGCRVGSSLFAGQILASGACLESPSGRYMLLMQSDGNLFIYDRSAGHVTWAANTYGHSGAYATLQSDGNFVVYATNGAALWNSGTYGTFSERLDMGDDGRIIIYKSAWNSGTSNGSFNWTAMAHPGCDAGTGTGWTGVLGSGQCFVSPNGRYELLMQGDGNLVIYDRSVTPNKALWSSGTAISPADPGFAMRTLYSYDALGNLLQVDQKGSAPNDSTQWRTRTFTYDSLSRLLTANNPESGTITYSYDADGNLLQKTSPAPNQTGTATQTVSYCYDELHRVTGKGYGAQSCPLSTPVVSYAYDSGDNAKGHLTSLTDQAGTATYTYDILGRLTAETRTLTGANNAAISKNLSYSYNLNGSLKSLTYPSGNVVTYTPDSAGRTLSAIDSGNGINYVTGATYGPDGALTGFVSGNSPSFTGITNAFSYNKRLQPLAMSASAPGQTVFSIGYDFHFGNGDNGNVFGITNYKDQNRNQTFTYDALNRLISAQNAGTDCAATVIGGKSEYWGNSYGYDAWGNLLQKSITKCGAEHLTVTADAHNWIHASGTDYQYDAAGNMTYDATASLSYNFDQENRLTGAAGYAYTYDGDGNRVRKSNSSSTGTLYWYMTPGIVGESDLSGNLTDEYVFFDGERVARKSTNGVFYYFSDHLKTASVVTDAAGVIKAESDYYPWGGELQFVANDSNHYKFTGKERDAETQLDYFGARYYSNGLGRWVSADWSPTPIAVPYADFHDPQSLNLYGYARNIPTTRFDPDGHCDDGGFFCDIGKGFLGGLYRATDLTRKASEWFHPISRPGGDAQAAETGQGNIPEPVFTAANKTQEVTAQVTQIAAPAALGLVGTEAEAVEVVDMSANVRAPSVLATRAEEIHGALDPIAQSMRTTAVADVTNADGTISTLVSSSRNTLAPAQRAVLQPGETAVSGAGHAEETILNAAQQNGQTVNTMGVSRTPCPTCQQKLDQAGVQVQGPN